MYFLIICVLILEKNWGSAKWAEAEPGRNSEFQDLHSCQFGWMNVKGCDYLSHFLSLWMSTSIVARCVHGYVWTCNRKYTMCVFEWMNVWLRLHVYGYQCVWDCVYAYECDSICVLKWKYVVYISFCQHIPESLCLCMWVLSMFVLVTVWMLLEV